MLHGRAAESARLHDLIDSAARSHGGALVLRGEPGAGKTALLTALVEDAHDMKVLWTQGIESESPLPFAALTRLLRPALDHLDGIPAAQARALSVALAVPAPAGAAEGAPTPADDRLVVFMAVLSLLADVAESGPVLCVVDDAQWLDSASGEALLFVARRLDSDRIALVFAARDGDVRRFDAPGIADLELRGLDGEAALAVLSERAGRPVAEQVRNELLRRTNGNPLALMELSGVLTDEQLSGRARLPPQLPLTEGVETAFLDRVRRLPDETQVLLLVAAADDSGRLAAVVAAAGRLGATDAALDAAERSGLVRVTGADLTLRHPLVRSAVYGAATSAQRRAAHRALAEVLTAPTDLDRQTWHRSLAASGVDESLAAALDAVADRAGRRAAHEAASAASDRAAELTPEADPRAGRLFAAAASAWAAGDSGRARALADEGRDQVIDPILGADIDRLRGRLEWNVGSPQAGHAIIMGAARAVAPTDATRAYEMAMLATTLATFGAKAASESADDTSFLPPLPGSAPPRLHCLDALITGHRHILGQDYRAAAPALRRALSIAHELPPTVDILANVSLAAFHLGDDDETTLAFSGLLRLGREAAAMSTVITALTRLPCGQLPAGDWRGAGASADEAVAVARAMGSPALVVLPLAWLAVLAAYQGQPATAGGLLTEIAHIRGHNPTGIVTLAVDNIVAWAQGVLAANDRDDSKALHHLSAITHPTFARLAAIDRLETAVRALQLDLADRWCAELESFGDDVSARWAQAAAAHGRALLADGEPAVQQFERALTLHDGAGRPVDRSRTELAYGEFLRRNGRRVDARAHLRRALDVFDDLGAQPMAERTRQEMRATGETARKRDVTTTEELTPQERQTALLVSQGLTNREVAARLFLSPRTIEYHLSHAYQKLGVRSRSELARLDLA